MKKICMACTFFVSMICLGGLYNSTQMNAFNIFSFVLVLNSFALQKYPIVYTEEAWVLYSQQQLFIAIPNHERLVMCVRQGLFC